MVDTVGASMHHFMRHCHSHSGQQQQCAGDAAWLSEHQCIALAAQMAPQASEEAAYTAPVVHTILPPSSYASEY